MFVVVMLISTGTLRNILFSLFTFTSLDLHELNLYLTFMGVVSLLKLTYFLINHLVPLNACYLCLHASSLC